MLYCFWVYSFSLEWCLFSTDLHCVGKKNKQTSCAFRESTLWNQLLSFYPHWRELSSSFTHSRVHWLPYTYRCVHTVTNCDAAQVKPHLWVAPQVCRDNGSLCWKTLDMPSHITLSPSQAPSFWMSVSPHVFWGKTPITWIGWRWGGKASAAMRDAEWEIWNAGR